MTPPLVMLVDDEAPFVETMTKHLKKRDLDVISAFSGQEALEILDYQRNVDVVILVPGVAFCIGLLLVFTGVVSRKEVTMLYWDDAVWFIMGSLMFAVAFVKTGVDKRVCLMMFRKLAVPNVRWITLIFFVIISPLVAFISDHALAAMFLPIGMLLYQNSLTREIPEDPELGKMIMITIAMACNIGGPGAPSGGARNVIMMTYLNDMFGLDIGYFQWIIYCCPSDVVILDIKMPGMDGHQANCEGPGSRCGRAARS